MEKRPTLDTPRRGRFPIVRPCDKTSLTLLGGVTTGNSTLITNSQYKALLKFYDFDLDYAKKHAKYAVDSYQKRYEADLREYQEDRTRTVREPKKPDAEKVYKEHLALMEAGDRGNLWKHVEGDGQRVMAFLARHLEVGEDPVRLLENILTEVGYGMSPGEWDMEDDDS